MRFVIFIVLILVIAFTLAQPVRSEVWRELPADEGERCCLQAGADTQFRAYTTVCLWREADRSDRSCHVSPSSIPQRTMNLCLRTEENALELFRVRLQDQGYGVAFEVICVPERIT